MKAIFLVVAVSGNTVTLTPQTDPGADAPPARHGEADANAGRQLTLPINSDEDLDFWNGARGKRVSADFDLIDPGQTRSTAGARARAVAPGADRNIRTPAQPGVSAPGASTPGTNAPQGAPAGTPASGAPQGAGVSGSPGNFGTPG